MSTLPQGSDHAIDGFSIFTIIVFFGINLLVVFPLKIPIPHFLTRWSTQLAIKSRILSPREAITSAPTSNASSPILDSSQTAIAHSEDRKYFPLGLSTAPVIGVLLLLASTSIPGEVVKDGIVGKQGVRPYDIMTLFLSLAYISISLDCTGLLRYMAFWVSLKGGTSGKKLYLYFYLFFFGFGCLVGNDPIILSGTAFLAYFSRIAGISPPRAWLFAQFAACNVASAILVSSNPTNLVITGAYHINFLTFSAWLALPVLATAVVLFPWLLWGQFNDAELIPKVLVQPDVDPKSALIDPAGAIFGSVLLGMTLVALVALSAVGLLEGTQGVWTVTAPAAIVMLCRDIWYDIHKTRWPESGVDAVQSKDEGSAGRPEVEAQGADDLAGTEGKLESGDGIEMKPVVIKSTPATPGAGKDEVVPPGSIRRRATGTSTSATVEEDPSETPPSESTITPAPTTRQDLPIQESRHGPVTLESLIHTLSRRFPTFSYIFVRLPLPLLPFAFAMFILVEGLQWVGWIRVFAGWWAAWVGVGGLAGAVFMMAVLSVIGCNVFGTNIGATILLSRVLQQWDATATVSPKILTASIYTLALGSNYGAFSYTFSASLAGLLWKDILLQKGIKIGRWEFAKNNLATVAIAMIVGSLVIAGEVCVIYR